MSAMNLADIERRRKREFIKKAIKKFSLNLEGLTVFTETATGNYLYTPIIAAMAGAERVFAITADSKYGKKEEVREQTLKEAEELGVASTIDIIFEKDAVSLSRSDIITNSGFVRPITRGMVSCMKPTAVIPLMWETWEFRPEELDLTTCREKGILVMGTNEHHPLLNLFRSIGFKVCKLLFDAGFSVYSDRLLLIASGDYGNSVADFFINNNISFDRVVFDEKVPQKQKAFVYSREEVIHNLGEYDAIIIAELYHNIEILSERGVIPTGLLKKANPPVQIIYVCGAVSKDDIIKEELAIYPPDTRPFGHIAASADYLGWKPVLELNTAGLKVGEAMARCRLKGITIEGTIKYALRNSPADAFRDGSLRG